jgi:hypothetical protein
VGIKATSSCDDKLGVVVMFPCSIEGVGPSWPRTTRNFLWVIANREPRTPPYGYVEAAHYAAALQHCDVAGNGLYVTAEIGPPSGWQLVLLDDAGAAAGWFGWPEVAPARLLQGHSGQYRPRHRPPRKAPPHFPILQLMVWTRKPPVETFAGKAPHEVENSVSTNRQRRHRRYKSQ